MISEPEEVTFGIGTGDAFGRNTFTAAASPFSLGEGIGFRTAMEMPDW